MDKPKLFNQQIGISLDKEELKNMVSIKLPDETKEYLENVMVKFPHDYFKRLLRQRNLSYLEETLFNTWKSKLPREIHQDCISKSQDESPEHKRNCYQSWLEFQTLYLLVGNDFARLIEINKSHLRKITKEKLAVLFFQKAFVFENGHTLFQVGEMSRLLLKEGLKDISIQLEKLATRTALEISNHNYSRVRKEALLNDNGFKDVEDFQKEFWEIEKEEYEAKLQIEECSQLSFIDYFVKGIKELQHQGSNQICIENIKEGKILESPFRYFFKALLSQNFESVEAEPEKGNGRIDLKITDKKLDSSIIIEFKGWWNKDKYNIIDQTLSYLTDFEKEGFIFMINHLKIKNIIEDYKTFVTNPKTNYIQGSWKNERYKDTGYEYYSSKHMIDFKEKKLNHFVFNANRIPK